MPQTNVCPVLVGRESELAMLTQALNEGGVVLVSGEAGIGKSRLLREFARLVKAHGHRVVWGRPEVVAEPGPYSLVVDLLESIGEALVSRASESLELAEALSSPRSASESPPARQIAARLRGLLETSDRRMVTIAEDLHAADEPSQAVLAHLARSASDDGLLLVGALRHEVEQSPGTARLLDLFIRERLALWMNLEPLSQNEQVEMLEAMWGRTPADEEAASILRLAGGVPFFLEELAAGGEPGREIPESVTLGVQARLQNLSVQARVVLEVASLSTGAIDPCVLARALAVDDKTLPGFLIEGVRVGLLADRAGRLEFRHSLLREAVSSRIVSVERERLHARVADAIESCHADAIEAHALALAYHRKGAGDLVAASQFYLVAGNRALRMSALDEAADQFGAVRTLAAREDFVASALSGLSEVEVRHGRLDEAIELQRAALDRIGKTAGPESVAARTRLAELLLLNGDPAALAVVMDTSTTAVEPRARAAALRVEGRIQREFGSHSLARERLLAALAVAEEAGESEEVIECCLDLTVGFDSIGDSPQAKPYLERAIAEAVAHRHPPLIGRAFSEDARRLYSVGRYGDALNRLETAREHLMRGLSSHLILGLDTLKALVLWRMGRPAEADRIAARLESGLYGRGYGRVIRVWAAIERGDEAAASQSLEAWWLRVGPEFRDSPVEELENAPDSPEAGGYAVLADAVLAAYTREPSPEQAERAYRYWQFCREWPIEDVRSYAAALAGMAAVRVGDLDRAGKILEEAEQGLVGPHSRALLCEVRGEAAALSDDDREAEERLAEAVNLFTALENSSDRSRVLIRLASIQDEGQGKKLLREALKLADEGGAVRYARKAEASLRALGVRPRAGRPRGSGRKEGLSAREEEVVTLVASGATNAEIAERLFLSARTVQDHIARAGGRLGVSGRAGLAAWAAKQGLI